MQSTFKVRENQEWLVIALQRVYERRLKKSERAELKELQSRIKYLRSIERDFAWEHIKHLEKLRARAYLGGAVESKKSKALTLQVEEWWHKLQAMPKRNRASRIAEKLDITARTVRNKLQILGYR